jgi:hypothetical protein
MCVYVCVCVCVCVFTRVCAFTEEEEEEEEEEDLLDSSDSNDPFDVALTVVIQSKTLRPHLARVAAWHRLHAGVAQQAAAMTSTAPHRLAAVVAALLVGSGHVVLGSEDQVAPWFQAVTHPVLRARPPPPPPLLLCLLLLRCFCEILSCWNFRSPFCLNRIHPRWSR